MKDSFKVQNSVREILTQIGEDPQREGLVKTPSRVAKAYEFMCGGYEQNPQEIMSEAMFETSNNEMVLVRDIEFYSLCEHHMLPFFGKAHVAYIPDKKVVGLSKIPRVVNVFARRLQLQEQLTEQIAAAIMEAINPKGVGVVTQARHMCMEMRGVEKVQSSTLSSALRGEFLKASTRAEFFNLINSPFHKN
ncbi:MAG: GTP cyclohydrolase I FolE [Campylobacterota bacterium]